MNTLVETVLKIAVVVITISITIMTVLFTAASVIELTRILTA